MRIRLHHAIISAIMLAGGSAHAALLHIDPTQSQLTFKPAFEGVEFCWDGGCYPSITSTYSISGQIALTETLQSGTDGVLYRLIHLKPTGLQSPALGQNFDFYQQYGIQTLADSVAGTTPFTYSSDACFLYAIFAPPGSSCTSNEMWLSSATGNWDGKTLTWQGLASIGDLNYFEYSIVAVAAISEPATLLLSFAAVLVLASGKLRARD